MTQSFINPLSKYTSDTLKTLPYSRLYFFENESSTPKEVFKDKDKNISWGVYAESDSAGNFPPIWFDGVCRATLKWSSNWLTNPAGAVQTGWPIDHIGSGLDFDNDVTIAGYLTADNLYSLGLVRAAGDSGFQSTSYTLNARNPIWSFGNANTYGISYFAGTPSIGAADKIGIHFGAATIPNSELTIDQDGNLVISGIFTAPQINSAFIVSSGSVNALTLSATAGVFAGSTLAASNGVAPGNTANAANNVLDYYLEGNFTPVIVGAGTAGVGTYSVQTGEYVRVGKKISFTINLTWSAHTGTSFIRIQGLPNVADANKCALSVFYDSFTVGAGKQLCARKENGVDYITLFACDPAGGAAAALVIITSGSLTISGEYFV